MRNKHYTKNKHCKNCRKKLSQWAKYANTKRCKSCAAKYQHKNNRFGKVPTGNAHWKWKNGRKLTNGYIAILTPNHPHCHKDGYVYEHRLVIEKHIKRYLKSSEIVHHLNGIRTDNRFINLCITSLSKHPRPPFVWKKLLQKRILQLERQILQLKKT